MVQFCRGAAQLGRHMPAVQVSLEAQARPHMPQLAASVCRSLQAPIQRLWPLGQLGCWHTPPTQVSPMPQAAPQLPQLAVLVLVSTQVMPQAVWPVGQFMAATQAPAVQVCEAEHAVPQVPQLLASVCGLTQPPPHRSCPIGQVMVGVHTPRATLLARATHRAASAAVGRVGLRVDAAAGALNLPGGTARPGVGGDGARVLHGVARVLHRVARVFHRVARVFHRVARVFHRVARVDHAARIDGFARCRVAACREGGHRRRQEDFSSFHQGKLRARRVDAADPRPLERPGHTSLTLGVSTRPTAPAPHGIAHAPSPAPTFVGAMGARPGAWVAAT
jgi:hypothetical protein